MKPRVAESPPRAPSSADMEEITALLDRCFPGPDGLSTAEDMPLVAAPNAPSRRLVVHEEGRVRSHGALHIQPYVLDGLEVMVGVIGAVATDPDHRGRGYASQIVRGLLDVARSETLDIVVLWADTPAWYERFGFVLAGRENLFDIPRDLLPPTSSIHEVRLARKRDRRIIRELHDREVSRTARTSAIWRSHFDLPLTDWYVVERHGRPAAYGVVGKGRDLTGCLHEFGGPESLLVPLISGILASRGIDRIPVMTAPWKVTAAAILAAYGLPLHRGVLGMIHVPDMPRICTRLKLPAADLDGDHDRFVRTVFGHPDESADPLLPFYLFGLDAV